MQPSRQDIEVFGEGCGETLFTKRVSPQFPLFLLLSLFSGVSRLVAFFV